MAAEKEKKNTVKIKLPRPTSKTDPNYVTVSVNYKVYKIQKGVEVEVPVEVAKVLENAEKAEENAYNTKMALEATEADHAKQAGL